MHWSLFGTGECICCKFLELPEIAGHPPVLGTLPQGASKADCSTRCQAAVLPSFSEMANRGAVHFPSTSEESCCVKFPMPNSSVVTKSPGGTK